MGLLRKRKICFMTKLIAVTSKSGDNELVIVGGGFNGHVGKSSEV